MSRDASHAPRRTLTDSDGHGGEAFATRRSAIALAALPVSAGGLRLFVPRFAGRSHRGRERSPRHHRARAGWPSGSSHRRRTGRTLRQSSTAIYSACQRFRARACRPSIHAPAGGGAEGLPCGFRRYLQGVVRDERQGNGSDPKGRYQRGLPGYHDPTAGIGGAAPATSALTLRLWLALFGFVICSAFAIWLYLISAPFGFVAALLVLAAVAVIDIAVILRRKRRGEPG